MPANIRTVQLTFVNRTAGQCRDDPRPYVKEEVRCTRASCPTIMQWYGAFCAGDDYDVLIDGIKQQIDLNGELDQSLEA